jgi:hypothetical protein
MMSGSARWKENRIRERIYLERLKHTETLLNGAGLNGANSPGGTPEALSSANIWQSEPESKEEESVTLELATRRRFGGLDRYLRVGVLRPVRNPLMMLLSKLEEKD